MVWFKIKSWHARESIVADISRAYCGKRRAHAETRDDLPVNEKTCESCLAYYARSKDA